MTGQFKLRSDCEPLSVSIVTAARMLGISRSKFYELIDTGEIATIKVGRYHLALADEGYNRHP